MNLTIAAESPRQPDVLALIEQLDQYLAERYPATSNHLLDIDALCAPDIHFVVARLDGAAVGCGALRTREGYGELKRVFVAPRARGMNVGAQILRQLEAQACHIGLRIVRLETGIHQPEALARFRRAGYVECAPFGDYALDPLSLFMEKQLAPSAQ